MFSTVAIGPDESAAAWYLMQYQGRLVIPLPAAPEIADETSRQFGVAHFAVHSKAARPTALPRRLEPTVLVGTVSCREFLLHPLLAAVIPPPFNAADPKQERVVDVFRTIRHLFALHVRIFAHGMRFALPEFSQERPHGVWHLHPLIHARSGIARKRRLARPCRVAVPRVAGAAGADRRLADADPDPHEAQPAVSASIRPRTPRAARAT